MNITEQEQNAIKELVKVGKVEYDELDKEYHLTDEYKKEIESYLSERIDRFVKVRAGKYISNNIGYILLKLSEKEKEKFIEDTKSDLLLENSKLPIVKLYFEYEIMNKYNFIDYLNFYKYGKLDISRYSEYLKYRENEEKINILKEYALTDNNINKDDKIIEINSEILEGLNKLGIIDTLKNLHPILNESTQKLNYVLDNLTNEINTYYFRIGYLIKLGVYNTIVERIKKEQFAINPNRIAENLKIIFDNRLTSIRPIIQAFEKKEEDSVHYPLKNNYPEIIKESLKRIGIEI